MWSLTTTVSANRSLYRAALLLACAIIYPTRAGFAQAEGLRPPALTPAGSHASIATSGTGEATFYLVGPSHISKQQVRLGQEIQLGSDQVRAAGKYLAILCSSACQSASFYVTPSPPASLSFLVHPSRVPVKQPDAISGVALPYDKFQNFVTSPVTINFQLKSKEGDSMSRPTSTQHGVAWFRANSGNHAGAAQIVAAVGQLSERRVVQQVASDPCNLRIKAQPTAKGILVETDPVRDCSGNPVPDGTIVTFTASGPRGKSTVDMPLKQGVARAHILASGPAVISVASGVVIGNQLRLGAQP
jgi:hypothetical protein